MASRPSGFRVEYGHGGRLIDDERWEVHLHRSPGLGPSHASGLVGGCRRMTRRTAATSPNGA